MACQDCVTGSLHEGTPLGREETLHGLQTYVTEPPNGAPPAALIVIVPDVFGWKLPNTRILADTYAKRGNYRVYVPEFMNGMIGVDMAAVPWKCTLSAGNDSHGAGDESTDLIQHQ